MDIAIEAEGLRKNYRGHMALRGVDLRVPTGTVLGVLGPNGAGKTTTVRILATLMPPSGGRAVVAGHDVVREPREVRRRIGLAGQYAAVDEQLTGRENLVLLGNLLRLGRAGARRRAEDLLAEFDLTEAGDRLVKTYSGGMRRRLDLAASLVVSPSVLFLDEPTTGLDPTSRDTLWQMIRQQVADGVTVLLTTQYLEEADQLADRIAVVDHGLVIAEGTPDELKCRVGGEWLEVSLAAAGDVPAAVSALASVAVAPPQVSEDYRTISVRLPDGMAAVAAAASALDSATVGVVDFALRRPSLDDVFRDLTGRPNAPTNAESTSV
ncbi:ATP-binding cassette domain-containing protein [Goodfellowiella coeruleoviolacea]|uniref:ABC-2 type transport system ATP-binding protein n=1 Tax=Goodfellowiella coeruleoviolacea TaxID=334858 RepID=A0AAE3G7R8_9PSEU|nr:ATP-binding cassette domain-containing protein [Goodfellowiella coeruleoviolacea]MCP2163202.1 ABC-2 type transport system ATP-binding protein [Goodfellowiella coeruleoviolacea]